MQAEHFIYATFNQYGIRIIQSPKVDEWLTEENLQYLFELGKHATVHSELINDFRTEQVVAYSLLKPMNDELGRRTVWNHTILVKYEDIILYDQIFRNFLTKIEPYFIQELDAPPRKLQPIQIK